MIVSLSFLLSHVAFVVATTRAVTTRRLLPVCLGLVLLGLAGCAGSLARDLVHASNRPGGLLAVVPCRHDPDIAGAVRTTVTGTDTRKKCDAVWTHPTASQHQLVEDMKACSRAAFWVLSPSAAQDQRLACMESKGYRRDASR